MPRSRRRAITRAARRVGLAGAILAHAAFLAACGSSAPREELSSSLMTPVAPAALVSSGAPASPGAPPAATASGVPLAPAADNLDVPASASAAPYPLLSAARPPMAAIGKAGGGLASLGAPPPRAGELIGLPPQAVAAFLGPPGFKRRDDPAEIWRYAAGTCFLDLFLYKQEGGFTVAHVEARGRSVVQVSADDCLRDLLETRNRGDSG